MGRWPGLGSSWGPRAVPRACAASRLSQLCSRAARSARPALLTPQLPSHSAACPVRRKRTDPGASPASPASSYPSAPAPSAPAPASGGDLFDFVVARTRLAEDEARVFFQQLVCAAAWCHSKVGGRSKLWPGRAVRGRGGAGRGHAGGPVYSPEEPSAWQAGAPLRQLAQRAADHHDANRSPNAACAPFRSLSFPSPGPTGWRPTTAPRCEALI